MDSFSQAMSMNDILPMKRVRLALKKKHNDDDQEKERRQKLQEKDERQAEVCRRAMERERQHHTHEEQLLGEKELTGVLGYLEMVYDSQHRRLKPTEYSPMLEAPEPGKLREVPVVPPQLDTFEVAPLPKYNRFSQERFLKEKQAFGINPMGSNIPRNVLSQPPKVRRRSRKPIIVVPSALSSLITLHNAKQLLQHMHFVPVEQARREAGMQHLEEVIIERWVKGVVKRYRVIDNVSRLPRGDWDQLAAVFALGPHWQFKGWPLAGEPALIFHRVCAFHLHFRGTPMPRELNNLQVHILSLPQLERHLDCGILMEFWNKLDQHIAQNPRQFSN
ncbi:hypothetical protein KR009_006313 [Drosophila setifemur]|nr:hypothetical protein KR009_006313 [Drosophila setifemur]